MQNIKISLAAARVNAKMTQSQVAEKMHVGKQTIVSWENGKTEPKTSQAIALSQLYEFPLDNIFLPQIPTKSEK